MADNITVTGTTDMRELDNSKLIDAIVAMRADFNPETQNKVINEALRATFLVPAVMETKQELVSDPNNQVRFQDKQIAKFVLINHKERGSFFPVFTSAEEFNAFRENQKKNDSVKDTPRPLSMKFGDIAGLTEKTPNVEGFVINPFHENLPFTKAMLASIKQTLIRVNQERAAAAKAAETGEAPAAPDITVSSNNGEE